MWVSMDRFDATTICADSVSKAARAPYNSTGNTGTTGQRQFRQCERLYHTNCVNWRELCAKKNKKSINDSLMRYKQWIHCIIYVSYLYNRLQIKYHHSMTPQFIIYHILSRHCDDLLGFPEITQSLGGQETDNHNEHYGLREQTKARLMQLRGIHNGLAGSQDFARLIIDKSTA